MLAFWSTCRHLLNDWGFLLPTLGISEKQQNIEASDEELEEVWEVAAPPPLASSPEPTCETYETGGTDTDTETDESAGPATPETFASVPSDGAPVPELALDIASAVGRSPAPSPEERDITMAKSRLGHGDKRRRARSMSRLVEGMKKIRIRA